MAHSRSFALAAVSLAGLAGVALLAAPAQAGGIVVESYTGSRGDEASHLLSPVLDELATRGFIGGYDAVGRKYEAEISRPSLSPEGLPADFTAQIERGHKAWIAGRFDDAVHILAPLVDAAHANTGAFAQNQPLREKLLSALIALALSQQRMGDPSSAKTTFDEILRGFPDAAVSRGTYGPEAFELFEQVKRDAATAGRGRLEVKVGSEAVVFINERFETVGPTTKGELLPGEYRVYAQLGKDLSRSHRVIVRDAGTATVGIDLPFDQALHTSPTWTGFLFASASERERLEAGYAAALANAVGASAIAVVGIEHIHGRASVVGALINLQTGREIRRASLAVDPDPPVDRLRALARFLAGDDAAKGIDIQVSGEAGPAMASMSGVGIHDDAGAHDGGESSRDGGPSGSSDRAERSSGGLWGGWKWITAVGAVGGLGVGGALLAINGKCSTTITTGVACPNLYNTKTPGLISLGGGVALAALTVYLFLRHDSSEPAHTAYVVPTDGGAMAGFATTF